MPPTTPVDWELVGRSLSGSLAHASSHDRELVHAFIVDKMEQVAAAVASLAHDEDRVRYIRGAFRNYVLDTRRREARYANALRMLADVQAHEAAAPEPLLHDGALDPSTLGRAIEELPQRLREAVRAYLGVGGDERSLRQIADALRISRHAARAAVVDGLLLLAFELDRGHLDRNDLAVAARVASGESADAIRSDTKLTAAQVRAAATRIRKAIESALG